MKRLGKIFIIFHMIATLLVIIMHPTMHKPASLERMNFKVKNELIQPRPRRISDHEIKVRFVRTKPIVVKQEDRSRFITSDEDERQLAFDFSGDNTKFRETSMKFEDNIGAHGRDVDVDTSSTRMSYDEQDATYRGQGFRSRDMEIGFEDTGMQGRDVEVDSRKKKSKSRDKEIGFDDQGVGSRDMQIGMEDQDIQQSDIYLEDVDEVGHRNFKGSREEIVAWNVWRSNLQNQIMMNSAVEAPVGTLISFSFNVSKNGNITNLKYSCSNRKYAAAAKADMIQVLKGLRYTEVVKFPPNTKRTNVKFKGAFLLDYSTSFSKPSDYSDYERVKY